MRVNNSVLVPELNFQNFGKVDNVRLRNLELYNLPRSVRRHFDVRH